MKNFIIFQLTTVLIYGIAVLALNILTGGSGQFSLGQSAFYALGAYTSAILIEHASMNYALTLPIAGVICFGFGFLFGLPALRLSGVYLALATFALATAMPQLLKLGFFEHWTGGVQGLVVTKPDAPFGLPMSQDMWLYYFTLAISIGIYIASVNLLRSRSGRAMMAIRDNEIAASAMGVDVALYKTLAFGVSAGITGVAGGLGAIAVQFVAPDSYTIQLAIALFLGMVVGGVGWLPGSIVGCRIHRVRSQHRGRDFKRPLRRGVRRPVVHRHLPCSSRRKAGGVRRPEPDRQTQEKLEGEVMLSKQQLRIAAFSTAVIAFAAFSGSALAQKKYDTGATDTEIKIGNIMPYSGPASAYGVIGKTEEAYFKMINDDGGIKGRKINFVTYDDGYSPPKAVEQARKLVESDEVLLVFNPLGTPSNSAIQKYLNSKKVPQLFVATGATKWNDPKDFPWTMGWQPSYQSEARIYAKYLMKEKPAGKIAVLYQNDDFGKDYLKGLKDGLGAKASMIIAEESYETSEPTIDGHIVKLKSTGADVFINITTPKFAAQAIKKIAEIEWKPMHIVSNVSASVGSVIKPAGLRSARHALGRLRQGRRRSAVGQRCRHEEVLSPSWRSTIPDGNKLDGSVVFGYGAAQTMVKVLEMCGDDLTRANVMKQAASLKDFTPDTLLPGVKINTSATDFAPIKQLQMMRFKGEKWDLFGDIISGDITN